MGKYKILVKEPASKEINGSDTFSVNLEFTDRARRIKIPMITAKVTQEEKETTRQTVDEVRAGGLPSAPCLHRAFSCGLAGGVRCRIASTPSKLPSSAS